MPAETSLWAWIRSAIARKLAALSALDTSLAEADNQREVEKLASDPSVLSEIEHWWNACLLFDEDDSTSLDFFEYSYFHSQLVRAFNRSNPPGLLEAAAERSLMIDWERDSKGDGIVDKDDFIRSVVELAVTWCEHTDILTPEVCTEFLHDLFGKLFSDLPEQQKVQWREHYQEHHTQVSKKQNQSANQETFDSRRFGSEGVDAISVIASLSQRDKLGAAFFSVKGLLRMRIAEKNIVAPNLPLTDLCEDGAALQIGINVSAVTTTPLKEFLLLDDDHDEHPIQMQTPSQRQRMLHWHGAGSTPSLPPLQQLAPQSQEEPMQQYSSIELQQRRSREQKQRKKTPPQQQQQQQQSTKKAKQKRKKKKKQKEEEKEEEKLKRNKEVQEDMGPYKSYWRAASKPADIKVVRLSPLNLSPVKARTDKLRKTPFTRLIEKQEHAYRRTGRLAPIHSPTKVAEAIWAAEMQRRSGGGGR
jgi:hypothetical protein